MENYLTYHELSKKIGRAQNTLRCDVMNNAIPYTKIGRQVRFRESEIENWLQEKSIPVRERKNG
jgi:excisionase family DNA binding protein